ncbi:serine/threonine-protein kinase [Stieleria marina]|uniref:non-specific serine/threonine protein kinase n=1 Tax=Stieleria marina TaxID=1930275 RepID=A0A517P2H1_9BACT|nr:Serine/threonine-protein kinase PrkC [Planctomycetes bacterium K23_9]
MADLPAPDDQLDEAFAAYLHSCDTGEVGSREEFLAQFPDLADDLKELMDAADMIGGLTQAEASIDTPAPTDTGAETISVSAAAGADDSGLDPAATLPMANRPKGDPGPTLPFDLGDYQLLEVLGRGGMGVVYLAKQNHLDRMVAVKMIRSGMLAGADEVRRFYTEAQAAARLHHPGIVSVHQFGHRAGHHFFSMEYVAGTDLQKRINGSILEPRVAARYVRDVANAIQHAHQNEVLHRDLKPANVLIDKSDRVHVTDFGLAKNLDADSSVTGSGAAVGTPHYMAPEQAGGHSDRASKQSDVYSLGAILFACVAGRPPLVGDTVMQTLLQVVHEPAPPLRSVRPETPVDLDTIVAKCLEKNPLKRYQSAEELADELDAFLQGRPIAARPRSAMMKTWHWLERVPVVGALTGRHVVETSVSHRRFQACILFLFLLTPLAGVALLQVWHHYNNVLPQSIQLAGGLDGGVYNDVTKRISDRLVDDYGVQVQLIPTAGSFDNRARLLAGDVHLAPMQASAISGDQLCVVAPLFYEAVHVVVHHELPVESIEDLAGYDVAVGPPLSGSRRTAELVFDSIQLEPAIRPREVSGWSEMYQPNAPRAAVICIGKRSTLVSNLLTSGDWKLVPIPDAIQISLQHPTLRPMSIHADEYPDANLPAAGIATIGTTAFLAARQDTPGDLVSAALKVLYEQPTLFPSLISRSNAAEWQGLSFHPVARRYFQRNQTQ